MVRTGGGGTIPGKDFVVAPAYRRPWHLRRTFSPSTLVPTRDCRVTFVKSVDLTLYPFCTLQFSFCIAWGIIPCSSLLSPVSRNPFFHNSIIPSFLLPLNPFWFFLNIKLLRNIWNCGTLYVAGPVWWPKGTSHQFWACSIWRIV